MATYENLGVLARVLQYGFASAWTGGAAYITLVECPSRAAMATPGLMLDNWQNTFSGAAYYMSRFSAATFGLGMFGWYTDTDPQRWLLLAAAMFQISIMPFTLIFIMPTNNALMDVDGARKKGDEFIKEKVHQWKLLHSGRIILGLGSCTCIGLYWFNKINKIF